MDKSQKGYKPKVVFTYVEAGMGHIVPITGLSDAFEKKYGDKCEIIRLKVFSDTDNQDVLAYGKLLSDDVKKEAKFPIYSALSYYSGKIAGRNIVSKILNNVAKKARPHVIEKLAEINPDFIFSTYYAPSKMAIIGRNEGKLDCFIGTYTSDPIVYPAWDRRGDVYIVNNDQAEKIAQKAKFKNVKKIPFILRQDVLNIKESKEEMRKKLGIPVDSFVIVLADGAYGQKNLVAYTEELLRLDAKITIVSVCGKNEQALEYLKTLKPASDKVTFIPLGFIKNMIEYNYVSDLFVGKGGANAIVESLYFNVPVIVSAYANVLESKISKFYITKKRCGKIIKNRKKFRKFMLELLKNPSMLDEYKENTKEFSNPYGAEKGADIIYEMLKTKFDI